MTKESDVAEKSGGLESVPCSMCGAAEAETELLPWFHVAPPWDGLKLRRCLKCGLVYQSPRQPESALAGLYDREYFDQGDFGGKDKNRSYFNPGEQADLDRFHRVILERIAALKNPPGLLLEVGCAGGHFLLLARDRGYRVMGIDISAYASEQARDRYGLEVATGTLESYGYSAEQFEVVYLKDVLEHVRDPRSFLVECHRIMKPGGLLAVLVPNYIDTAMMRLYVFLWTRLPFLRKVIWAKRGQYLLDTPFHLYEFTPASLAAMMKKAGFRIVRTDCYTLPPLPLRHGGRLIGGLRGLVRWIYFGIVSLRLLEGDRLDVYCLKE